MPVIDTWEAIRHVWGLLVGVFGGGAVVAVGVVRTWAWVRSPWQSIADSVMVLRKEVEAMKTRLDRADRLLVEGDTEDTLTLPRRVAHVEAWQTEHAAAHAQQAAAVTTRLDEVLTEVRRLRNASQR